MRKKWIAGGICLYLAATLSFAQSAAPGAPQPAAVSGGQAGPAAVSPPAQPITLDQTREMFRLMHFNSMMEEMLHSALDRQRQNAPFVPEDVWQDFDSSFAKIDFVEAFLPVYQKYLSREDAARAIAFYQTPAGQHMLTVMPSLMQELAVTSQQKGEEVGKEVLARHHQEIEDAEKKYNQQAPAAAPGPALAPSTGDTRR